MVGRILVGSVGRQRRRKLVALTAVTLGTAAASALLNVALGVGDKVSRELRGFGANLAVYPAGAAHPVTLAGLDVTHLRAAAYLDEADIRHAKENFWIHNILALAPALDATVEVQGRRVSLLGTWFERPMPVENEAGFIAGVRGVFPFWSVDGHWPKDLATPSPADAGAAALVGRSVAASLGIRPGDRLRLQGDAGAATLAVTGVLSTGGPEDRAVVTGLSTAQELAGLPGRVSRILVSALTTPESAALARLDLEPSRMSPEEFERWSCTPFVSSIAHELERSVPGSEARPIRRVAEAEGRVLGRVSGLMGLLAAMAVAAAALTVSSALTTGVLERRAEIGLLKALGASNARVIGLFMLEAAVLGLAGGVGGAALGAGMARFVALAVFGSPVELSPFALPLAVLAAVAITLAGCALPARRISSFRPSEVLHGR